MLVAIIENEWSLEWLSPLTFFTFEWESFWYLYLFPIIPLLFLLRWLLSYRYAQKIEVALTAEELIKKPIRLLRFVPNIILSIVLLFLLIAAARPQRTNEQIEVSSEGIDIILAIDISQSMLIEDFQPNRLEAAKKVATDFISGRKYDRIGIVIFSGEAYSLAPLTTDYQMLKNYLQDLAYTDINQSGTAIGSALAVSTNRLRESSVKTKVIILISDGDNTAGNIDPTTAAQLARAYNIKVYSILVGIEGKVPAGKNAFGITQYVENTIDETTLKEIAKIGEGKFFRASNNKALQEVFTTINRYEKSEIKETRFQTTQDYYFIYLRWAMVFLIIWITLKSTFIANALED
ncbi:MAG: VWA domain-containing protein [Cytophagales bacterium]|nr:MAG: VWA domain-containing protein [Cytophagales bacterium]